MDKKIVGTLTLHQTVTRVGDVCSLFDHIHSGVIQGSYLGPLLFLIFINYITARLNVHVNGKMYADGVKLYTKLRFNHDNASLQTCLDSIYRAYQWSKKWHLEVSEHKCCVIDIGKPGRQ